MREPRRFHAVALFVLKRQNKALVRSLPSMGDIGILLLRMCLLDRRSVFQKVGNPLRTEFGSILSDEPSSGRRSCFEEGIAFI